MLPEHPCIITHEQMSLTFQYVCLWQHCCCPSLQLLPLMAVYIKLTTSIQQQVSKLCQLGEVTLSSSSIKQCPAALVTCCCLCC